MLFSAVTGRHRKTRGWSRTRDLLAVWQPALTSILRILFVRIESNVSKTLQNVKTRNVHPTQGRPQALGNRTHNLLAVSANRRATVSWPAYCDDTATLLLLPLAMIVQYVPLEVNTGTGPMSGLFRSATFSLSLRQNQLLCESALCCVYVASPRVRIRPKQTAG